MIRAQFEMLDAVRCIYIGEAWTLTKDGTSVEEINKLVRERGSIANHPDRIEIVQVQGEDCECGQIMAQRRIVRPANRKPYLDPLEIIVAPGDGVASEGRMIGFLPPRGTRQ